MTTPRERLAKLPDHPLVSPRWILYAAAYLPTPVVWPPAAALIVLGSFIGATYMDRGLWPVALVYTQTRQYWESRRAEV